MSDKDPIIGFLKEAALLISDGQQTQAMGVVEQPDLYVLTHLLNDAELLKVHRSPSFARMVVV